MQIMAESSHHLRQLERLRRWRNGRPTGDLSLSYMPDWVKRQVVQPHVQLGRVVKVWQDLIPGRLCDRTALVSLSRGVLTVHVTDSPTMYELDRLLRGGLERRIKTSCRAKITRIKLKLEG